MILLDEWPITATVRDALAADGTLAPAVALRPLQPIANAPGLWGTGATMAPRPITIGLDVDPTSLPDRVTTMDAIKRRVSGLRLLRLEDAPTREMWVTCTGLKVELYHFSIPRCYVELQFTAADPARYERDPVPLALSTSRASVTIGTQSVAPRLWIYGGSPSVVNPVVIVRNAQGDETHRLTLSGTLATNDALDIDAARQNIDLYSAGTLQTGAAGGNSWLASGDFPLFDPDDAIDGAGLTVELSATSGTPTGLLLYRRGF